MGGGVGKGVQSNKCPQANLYNYICVISYINMKHITQKLRLRYSLTHNETLRVSLSVMEKINHSFNISKVPFYNDTYKSMNKVSYLTLSLKFPDNSRIYGGIQRKYK